MATTFRTKGKGKDRKVYPIGKRKPYGVSRPIAVEDIKNLREKGKRARLIETNTRLDLFAPYVSALGDQALNNVPAPAPIPAPVQHEPVRQPEPAPVVQKIEPATPENRHFAVNSDKNRAILTSLGILNDKGNLNELKSNYKMFFEDSVMNIKVNNGRAELTAMDDGRIALINERFFTDLPSGTYTLKTDSKGIPQIVPLDEYDGKNANLKLPQVDFKNNAAVLSIPNDKIKDFVTMLNETAKKSDSVKFKSGKDGGMDIYRRGVDEDGNDIRVLVYHYDYSSVPEGIDCSLPTEYLASTINTMLGRSRVNKPTKISDFNLKIKSDYPAEVEFTGLDGKGEPTGYRALIAPRIE